MKFQIMLIRQNNTKLRLKINNTEISISDFNEIRVNVEKDKRQVVITSTSTLL